ncbi:MAG: bifunctional alpha/beta hydrolase/OsmC family protein [Bacteroidota bacterium]
MKTTKVNFFNAEGEKLAARLELPVDQKPFTYALFAHCFTCNKNLTAIRNISRGLTLRGIGVLRFDFTGLGESEGDFADTNFSSNVQDLITAAEFLAENYGAPEIMIGHSLGGAATLMAAPSVSSAQAVVTIGAPADPAHVLHLFDEKIEEIQAQGYATVSIGGRPFTVKEQFLRDLEATSLADTVNKMRKALLVMHSPFDKIVGINNAGKIYDAARHPKSFVTLDTADHLLMDKHDSLYTGSVIATWLTRYIDFPEAPELHSDKQVVVRTGPEGYLTEIRAGNHHLVADEPVKVGGTDLGPTPYDLLVAALGACTSMTLRMYADRKQWPLENIIVHLQHSKVHAEDCADSEQDRKGKIDQIARQLELEGDLSAEQRQRLKEIADRCPVHRTLHNEIRVVTQLRNDV